MHRRLGRFVAWLSVLTLVAALGPASARAQSAWRSYARDPQHTATSAVASQCLGGIRWQTPVNLNPQYSGGELLIHYGSPLVTTSNTAIVPVKTGPEGPFRVDAHNGIDGALKWTLPTGYLLPPHSWTPSFSPCLTPGNRLYFPGAGGTVHYCDTPDAAGPVTVGQLAFYGVSNYLANPPAYNNTVFINTPITSDDAGNIFFGFQVVGTAPLGLASGIARIDRSGTGTWAPASTAANDAGIKKVAHNCAPALSHDGSILYIAVNNGTGTGFATGYLLALDSTTLTRVARTTLKDVKSGFNGYVVDDGTSSPTVGPDGDVYFGVLENPLGTNHYRGWLLHFSGDLAQSKQAGAFGWDDTAAVVPASMVPSYSGSSSYLLMTKYNNYGEAGGDGVNRIAILDPFASMTDPISGATVMQEVLTIAGPTPDLQFRPGLPNAVREWCINSAAVDPATRSILANNEDGKLYRWDLTTNTLVQPLTLTTGIGEAYTPTLIGPDGTVYAINNAILFALGRTLLADLTCDGDVDQDDFDLFGACQTGAAAPYDPGNPPPGCTLPPDINDHIAADFDHDGDIDQADFGILQRCYTDPSTPPDPSCTN